VVVRGSPILPAAGGGLREAAPRSVNSGAAEVVGDRPRTLMKFLEAEGVDRTGRPARVWAWRAEADA
jgi:hypothetical protein